MTRALTVPDRAHSERAHSPWGASGASRWMKCAASVWMLEQYPQPTSAAANEGTLAHECLEKLLYGEPADQVAFKDDAMRGHVVEVYDWIMDLVHENPGAILYVERKFKVTEDIWGTNDAMIYAPATKTLYVIDLKYGMKLVEARGNPQLRIYGIGGMQELAAEGLEVHNVRITIAQPRAEHPLGPFRSEWVSPVDMLDFLIEIERAVEKTKFFVHAADCNGGFPEEHWQSGYWRNFFAPDRDTCHYCARAHCRAPQQDMLDSMDLPAVPDDDALPPRPTDIERLVAIAKRKDSIIAWLKACHDDLLMAGLRGEDLGDMKVVKTKPRRSFLDDQEKVLKGLDEIAQGALDKSAYTVEKLRGIGDIEKGLMTLPDDVLAKYGKTKKARLKGIQESMAELMDKKSGSFALAHISDEREAVKSNSLDEIDLTLIADFEGDE